MNRSDESEISSKPRRIALGILLYAVAASSIGSALVARHLPMRTDPDFLRLLIWQAPTYLLWGAIVPLVALVTRVRWSPALLTIAGPFVVALASSFNVWWRQLAHPDGPFTSASVSAFSAKLATRWPIDLLIYTLIVAATLAYRWLIRALAASAARTRAEQQLTDLQLQTLKSKLQPHFLFNTLHTINALIERDPSRAQAMLENLAALLRLTLDRHDDPMTAVAGELEVARLYLSIQKERFGDRLQVVETIDDAALQCRVPDLLLQPIIENAVAHGIAPLRGGGTVEIHIEHEAGRLRLTVADNGAGLDDAWEEGIGVGATRLRLEYFYGNDHRFSIARRAGGGTIVEIDLPAEGVKR